jgi:L-malate glycosyltransferase
MDKNNKRPVRIMDLRGTYKGGGGPDKTILLSAAKHDKSRVYVLVTYLRDPNDAEFEIADRAKKLNISYIDVSDRRLIDLSCILKLSRVLREQKIDIVHAHDDKSSLYAFLLKLINPRIKIMYTAHCYCKFTRADFSSLNEYMLFHMRKAARYFLLARSNRPILAVSEAVRRNLIEDGLSSDDVVTLHNGIDTHHWQRSNIKQTLKTEFELPQDAFLIGTVARIAYEKDFPTFFKVAESVRQKYHKVWFVIVGDGEGNELEKAKQRAYDCGVIDYVFFTGHRNDLLDVYASFDLFLMTSISEGLPNTILEAMAMEVPVVSTSVGGVSEVVLDRKTGFLCSYKDVSGLANDIGQLIENKDLRQTFAKNSREHICKHFSFDERVKKMEMLYKSFIYPDHGNESLLKQEK